MKTVSVIVPVYKTEKYINECVNSILQQTYKQIELILVDDESPDQCGEMCDQFAKNDDRIKVIHKENGGLSDARNAGVTQATGDYVVFMDSDDYWQDTHGLETLASQMEQQECDVLSFHYQKYYENTGQTEAAFPSVEIETALLQRNKAEQFLYLMEHSQYIASACNKMIKRSLFEQHDLAFRKGVFSEDIEWCARLAVAAERFGVSNVDFYMYRQRGESITHSLTIKNLLDFKNSILQCAAYAKTCEKQFAESYLHYVAYQYAVFFVSSGYVKDKRIKEIYEELKPYAYLLDYCADDKVKQMRKVYKLSGYKGLCLAGKMYAKIRK